MTRQKVPASVKVDGDRLAEALRRVTPFMAEWSPPNLACVYAESRDGVLQLTTTDGFRMAHLAVVSPFPVGEYLMKGAGVKDFSSRHYDGAEVEVSIGEGSVVGTLLLGEAVVDLETTPYVDYRAAVPGDSDLEAIIDTKAWIRIIRHHKPEVVGVVYSVAGCRMFLQSRDGETTACEPLPVQMISGPDKKVAYNAERFRKALASCGPCATIQVGDPARATLFEAEDYWHILMPYSGFPKEVNVSQAERGAIAWAQEALEAVRKGDVPGFVLVGGGKFYLELSPGRAETEIRLEEPRLEPAAAAVAEPETRDQED